MDGIPFDTDVLFKFSDKSTAVGYIHMDKGYPIVSLADEERQIFDIVAWQYIGEWNNVEIS